MRSSAAGAGRTARTSMAPRRRSTTGSCAGPSAASGKASSARSPAPRRPTDCSSIRAASRPTAAPAGQKGGLAHGIGRTKGGRNTKLHAVCDARGRPLVLVLTPGNTHDCKVAQLCIEALPPSAELVADKGYDSQPLREWLEARGTTPVIPPRRNRKLQYGYDRAIYKERNVIERMFCRLKDWRRIATRYDRNLKTFMSAVALAAAVIWWL